jgi:Zn-finger nucleic acid-binding protein
MNCSACDALLDVKDVFPGGKIVCACGAKNEVPAIARQAQAPSAAPYRAAEPVVIEAHMIQCPFCGGPCAPDVRACPHCDVPLASVRCPHCFALHFTGSRFCARCGKELELEALLDATDAPCPRCDKPLSTLQGSPTGTGLATLPMHECTSCGGIFVSQEILDTIVARGTPAPHSPTHPRVGPPVPVEHAVDVVRYVKCPLCHDLMNRVNFGKRSGVIVDVCKTHGVWFDRGELTRVIEFVAKGGLNDPGDPAQGPKSESLRHEAAKLQVALMEDTMREARDEGWAIGRFEGRWRDTHHTTLLDILFELFR